MNVSTPSSAHAITCFRVGNAPTRTHQPVQNGGGLAGGASQAAGRRQVGHHYLDLRRQHYVPAICLARVCSRLGNTTTAIEWLEVAFAERNGEMVFLEQEIAGAAADDPLRQLAGEPRVSALLDSMRLPKPM